VSKMHVSVVMPNYNCAKYLRVAITSALEQDIDDLEVIVVDDASTDDSVAVVEALAARWPDAVRLFRLPTNQGSAAARNMALDQARGRWIAVLDSDDFMHPRRLSRLIARAEELGADMIADDMLTFYNDGSRSPHRLLGGVHAKRAGWVDLPDYVENNQYYSRHAALGYLKPVWRADRLRESGVRYDRELRLAQDYDFVLRQLEAGLKLWIEPEPLYFYRKHSGSNSHRSRADRIESLIEADHAFEARAPKDSRRLTRVIRSRRASLYNALAFDRLVTALKARRPGAVLSAVRGRPQCLALLREPIKARLRRLAPRAGARPVTDAAVLGGGEARSLVDALKGLGLSSRSVTPGPSLTTPSTPADTKAWLQAARHLAAVRGPTLVTDPERVSDASFSLRPQCARVAFAGDGGITSAAAQAADLVLFPDARAAEQAAGTCPVEKRLCLDTPAATLVERLMAPVDPATRVGRPSAVTV
jgi:glycosyltransferase involved in cell wall biosynthesis